MSDVMIIRRGYGLGGSGGGKGTLITNIFTANNIFTVPIAVDNKFWVRLFGGGGGGGCSGWGASHVAAAGGGG